MEFIPRGLMTSTSGSVLVRGLMDMHDPTLTRITPPTGCPSPPHRQAEVARVAESQRRADVARAQQHGREEAKRDVLRWSLEDADFRKYLFRGIADRMSHQIAPQFDRWMRQEIDAKAEMRKRFTDAILNKAMISPDYRREPLSMEEVAVVTVRFPPMDFHMAHPLSHR